MRISIKKKADLENILGKELSTKILKLKCQSEQRLPRSVVLVPEKPQFFLNDGSTLTAYAVDLASETITNCHYCGSADTIAHHADEQLGEGHKAPENKAMIFKESYWNGRNMSYNLTVVSPNIVEQLA